MMIPTQITPPWSFTLQLKKGNPERQVIFLGELTFFFLMPGTYFAIFCIEIKVGSVSSLKQASDLFTPEKFSPKHKKMIKYSNITFCAGSG